MSNQKYEYIKKTRYYLLTLDSSLTALPLDSHDAKESFNANSINVNCRDWLIRICQLPMEYGLMW